VLLLEGPVPDGATEGGPVVRLRRHQTQDGPGIDVIELIFHVTYSKDSQARALVPGKPF
jgi:hypothetical protein